MTQCQEGRVDSVPDDVEHILDAGLTVGSQAPERSAADHDGASAESECLDYVVAATDSAVEHDFDMVTNGLDYPR
jgi:hypothetical protein